MESQPQNPEFRINPENFHPCITVFINPEEYEHILYHTSLKVQNYQIPEL